MERTIDVPSIPPAERHQTIMAAWSALEPEDTLTLISDHDPLALYLQLAHDHAGRFHWEYLERGPAQWRVRLRNGDFPDPGFKPDLKMADADQAPAPVEAAETVELDLRPLFARGEAPCELIETTAARIAVGQTLRLLAPFEPRPLYAKLGMQGFEHETRLLPDGTWELTFRRMRTGPAVPLGAGCGH